MKKILCISIIIILIFSGFVNIINAKEKYYKGNNFESKRNALITYYCKSSDGSLLMSHKEEYYDLIWNYETGLILTEPWLDIGQFKFGVPGDQYWIISRSFVYFDTSSMPDDAVIISATLSIYLYQFINEDSGYDIIIQNGQPTYPHDPLDILDYNRLHYSGNGGSINSIEFNEAKYYDVIMNDDGKGWINKQGTTKLCLRTSNEISGDDSWNGQCRAYSSENGQYLLPKLTVEYNTPPNKPEIPSGTTAGYHGMSYDYSTSAIDPENQQVKIYFDWGDGTGTWTDYVNSGQSVTKSHTWNSPGAYHVKAKAKDIYNAEGEWSDELIVNLQNQAPHIPNNPNPEDGATNVGTNTILTWNGGDPNGDTVYYDVYLGTDEYNLDCVSTDQTSTTYNPSGELEILTTYYWKIIAEDQFGDQAPGQVWSFTTREYHAPILSYYDGWQTGHQPDEGNQQDDFTFCIHYQDADEDSPIVKKVLFSNGKEFSMELFNGEAYNGDYKVVLKGSQIGGGTHTYWFWYEDIHDDVRFPNPGEEDAVTINYAPNAPTLRGPTNGQPNTEYIFSAVSDDPEGDEIKYKFDWGDGKDTGWIPETQWKPSGSSIDAQHSWSKGTYTIKAKAMDREGDESPWSNEITIKVQKSRSHNYEYLREIIENMIQKFPKFYNLIFSFSR